MSCNHMNFDAAVSVHRLEDSGRFISEIKINCKDCGIPMIFQGLKTGIDLNGATVSLSGLEASIAIAPQGSKPSPFHKIMGVSVN